ncbi:TULP1 [Enterospora canceri]|uniref:TULP1 n=1 Tax=Enterospora canceri TaxID=1081671 RepID=A0A1Y1S6I4_9MICR|nr:TULP1 [Enterospora canceri]
MNIEDETVVVENVTDVHQDVVEEIRPIDLDISDEILAKNGIEKITKAKVVVESLLLNNYIYIHSDDRRLMCAKRTMRGFNIYDLRTNEIICKLSANIFGTKYSVTKLKAKTSENMQEITNRDGMYRSKNNSSSMLINNPNLLNTLPALSVSYDVKFLKRETPRSFKIKMGQLGLQNKQPIYNPETNAYSLNFSGRVTVASVKNFQIVHPLELTFITLTFGKEGNESYILDFTHPWNALHAFCVALTALDHKLGFE